MFFNSAGRIITAIYRCFPIRPGRIITAKYAAIIRFAWPNYNRIPRTDGRVYGEKEATGEEKEQNLSVFLTEVDALLYF